MRYKPSPDVTENKVVELDRKSSYLFPAVFIIFNLVYWTYFILLY